ncbi:MAG: hypothetical protein JXB85_14635 [Anaerolineales bacterium]|nr:hypothetical protein [Anaerolineales bacterium]
MANSALEPLHFLDQPVDVHFDRPPVREKAPPCPDGFTWEGRDYRVVALLAEWSDFTRRGRPARNMQPAHAAVASRRGSLGVGRFYFRIRTDSGQIFDLYYDRAIRSANDRKGHWFLYREMGKDE